MQDYLTIAQIHSGCLSRYKQINIFAKMDFKDYNPNQIWD